MFCPHCGSEDVDLKSEVTRKREDWYCYACERGFYVFRGRRPRSKMSIPFALPKRSHGHVISHGHVNLGPDSSSR